MKKNYLLLAIATTLVIVSAFFIYHFKKTSQAIYSRSEATEIINDVYNDVSGFSIDLQERQFIEKKGGNATYGEITTESVAQLLNNLKLTSKDIFYDLGSGVGKVCVQVALTTPAQAVGVELSPTRYQGAQLIKEELIKRNILINSNKLKFIEQNITDADLSPATVILLCSTCFSDELMQTLTNKMAQKCSSGLRVLTLKDLPAHEKFTLLQTYELPMSWSQGSPVYFYQLKNKIATVVMPAKPAPTTAH